MTPLSLLLPRVGLFVRTRREQAGYSQERFAALVGVHRTYMGLLERGEAPNPTVGVLDAIAQRLGLNMLDMLTLAIREDGTAAQAPIPAEGDLDRSDERGPPRPLPPRGRRK